jgi:hydrogenase maturation factor
MKEAKPNVEIDYVKRMMIGVKRGVSMALDRHKKLGQYIVVSRDGKIIRIPPEDIVVPPYPDDSELD